MVLQLISLVLASFTAALALAVRESAGVKLHSALRALSSATFYLHVIYQAISYRREAEALPRTNLLRRLLVPTAATMAGSAAQAAAFGEARAFPAKLRGAAAPLLLCWASVNLLPARVWAALSAGAAPPAWLARTAAHAGEAINKATGMVGALERSSLSIGCTGGARLPFTSVLGALALGGVRGAASTWVRSVDQALRGGSLRAKGIRSAADELQRSPMPRLPAPSLLLMGTATASSTPLPRPKTHPNPSSSAAHRCLRPLSLSPW
eukprot:CAMPEP_0177616830 /NCGR_PEP_ID=MMETSP0419_2-20121207/24439_1 /TAXON_ID=582737 /ORGANISM="Tetraselmis sp., Strain GSL018" /LENGTH=265 /DNA_ID=CAMNT_0019115063 /DNA_START=255 /DNA_END=1049 /DNA_ORIENTATION=-